MHPLSGRSILVVEDNVMIAMDLEDMIRDCGAEQVTVAGSVAQALRILKGSTAPDAALLDVNLGSETSAEIAEHLMQSGIPFAFATGYDDPQMLPEALRERPLVQKPYNKDEICRILGEFPRRADPSG